MARQGGNVDNAMVFGPDLSDNSSGRVQSVEMTLFKGLGGVKGASEPMTRPSARKGVHGVTGVEGIGQEPPTGNAEKKASTPYGGMGHGAAGKSKKCPMNGCGFAGKTAHGLGQHMKSHGMTALGNHGMSAKVPDSRPPHERAHSSYKDGDKGGSYGC
jgi:hypothetical protein